MNHDSLSSFVRSRLFAGIVTGVGITLIIVVIFEVGVAVGYHEATFSSRWSDNYSKNFGGDSAMGLPDDHAPNPDGTFGKIIRMSSSTIVIDNDQQPEQKVLLENDTVVRNRENTVATSSLSEGAYVVVLGDPNDDGEILAKLIRIVPGPSTQPAAAQQ